MVGKKYTKMLYTFTYYNKDLGNFVVSRRQDTVGRGEGTGTAGKGSPCVTVCAEKLPGQQEKEQ